MGWSKDHGTAAKVNAEYAKVQGDIAKQEANKVERFIEDNKTNWLPAVATVALRNSTYPNPQHGDTVRVTSEAKTYRFVIPTGWVVTDIYDATAIDQVTTQLAQTAQKSEVLLKSEGVGLNDAKPDLLAAIEGGEGTSFNLLSIPRDRSVTHEKTDFILVDKRNLFNPKATTDGVRLNTDGTLLAATTFYTSDFMPVKGGRTYLVFANNTTTGRVISYDDQRNFLSMISTGLSTTSAGAQITPVTDGYIRISFVNSATKSNVQFVDSEFYSGSYVPYSMSLDQGISVSLEALPDKSIGTRLLAKGSVDSENIVGNAIDLSYHTNFTPLVFDRKPRNLFNKNAVKSGFYIANSNGAETPNASYVASEFIRVVGGQNYSLAFRNQGAWYDSDKRYLEGIPNVAGNTIQAPAKAYYMRMSTVLLNVSSQMIVEGTVLGDYEEHFTETSKKLLNLLGDGYIAPRLKTPYEIARDILFSSAPKKIKLLGDSRTHGSGGTGYAQDGDLIPGTEVRMNPNGYCWANSLRDLLAWKYNVTVVNYAQAGKNSLHFYQQMNTLIEDDDDLIIMMLGTNDRHNMASVENTKTYQRAIIELAQSKGIPVILMSAPPVTSTETTGDNDPIRNFGMFDLDKALQELAAEYDMEHISNYDNTLKFAEYRGVSSDTLLSDGLHENDAGHDVIFRHVLRSLGITYVRPGVTK